MKGLKYTNTKGIINLKKPQLKTTEVYNVDSLMNPIQTFINDINSNQTTLIKKVSLLESKINDIENNKIPLVLVNSVTTRESDVLDKEKVFKKFSDFSVRSIRIEKTEEAVINMFKDEYDKGTKVFIFLFEKEVGSKIGLVDENYRSLNSLITNGISNDKIQLFSINKNEIVLGFVCLYFHKNIINYLKGTLTTEGKKVGGMYFAFDQIIRQYAAKDCIFDFGGSNVKGIASFYEKFGAKNLTYYSHEYNQLPKLINKLKKIKDKLL